jgi:hypothetical protein
MPPGILFKNDESRRVGSLFTSELRRRFCCRRIERILGRIERIFQIFRSTCPSQDEAEKRPTENMSHHKIN